MKNCKQIYVSKNNKKFLELLKKELSGDIVENKSDNFLCLRVEIERMSQEKFWEIFAQTIISYFKYNYLNNNINLSELQPDLRLALIQALTYFDADLDTQLLLSKFDKLSEKIYVESFLQFIVPELESRCIELCSLANNNSSHFIVSETFMELLKFILSNLKFNGEEIQIFKVGNNIYGVSANGKNKFSFNEEDELQLVLKLIEQLPRKIIVTIPTTECHALNLICKLFTEVVTFKNQE